ncbi:hypothetical protein TNIN_193931 [Trichonephila inaurata madagascariensis]|uniref:Uncharacterized protein n=1 Tax=Trichonephila inaurata madagascariensis TaxID=2747483 RepID=A0A8X7BZ13_9ARAC|nr:hypothetical protein TNIN_193931 [Trichonephila inaurata madagascariensis]
MESGGLQEYRPEKSGKSTPLTPSYSATPYSHPLFSRRSLERQIFQFHIIDMEATEKRVTRVAWYLVARPVNQDRCHGYGIQDGALSIRRRLLSAGLFSNSMLRLESYERAMPNLKHFPFWRGKDMDPDENFVPPKLRFATNV